ncbi:MAG: PAS domain S-box protein [Sulfuricellaceae bacterium]
MTCADKNMIERRYPSPSPAGGARLALHQLGSAILFACLLWLALFAAPLHAAALEGAAATRQVDSVTSDPVPEFSLHDIWHQYRWLAIASLAVGGLILLLGFWVLVKTRKLIASHNIEVQQKQQLEDSEQRYRFLFSNNPLPMFVLAEETFRFLEVNERAIEYYGFTREEFGRMTLHDLRVVEGVTELERAISSSPRGKVLTEARQKKKGGAVVNVAINAMPMQYGKTPAWIVLVQDITGRRALQKKITEQLAFIEAVVNAEVNGLSVCYGIDEAPYTRFTVWNPSMEALTGYRMEEINRLGWYQTAYPAPEMQEQARQRMERMRQGDHLRGEEWTITRKDGSHRVVQVHTVTVAEDQRGKHTLAVMQDITERKQTINALRESENRYRLLVEYSPYCVHEIDLEGRIQSMNRAGLAMLGLDDAAKVCGMQYLGSVSQQDAGRVGALLQDAIAHGIASHFEFAAAGDARRYFESCFIPIKDADGKVLKLMGITEDITERKQAEKALREKTRLLDSIVENIPNTIFIKRASDLRYELLNRAGEALVGHSREELLGRNDYDLFPKEQADFFTGKDRATLEQDGITDIAEEPIETPRGTRILHTRKLALRDEHGELQYLLGISEDITERKRAQDALVKLSLAVEQSPTSIVITDLDANIEYANEAFVNTTGYSLAEAIGQNPRLLQSGKTPKATYEEMWCKLTRGEVWQGELINRRKDGSEYIELALISPVCQPDGRVTHYLAVKENITERKQYEEELKRSNAELEQFSYAVSHDMRQPLRMVSSYLQLIEKSLSGQLDNEKRDYFNFAIDGAKRIDQMLVALLEYSRVGRIGEPPTRIDSRAALDEALQFLQPAIAEARAKLEISGDWPRIMARHDEILSLIQNLIGNAIKYRVAGRTPEITVSGEVFKNEWQLCVADNGVGIIPDQIKRLFQVFQRLHSREAYEGTGIGLALCRKIAEHHKGRIWAESAGEGRGSQFCVVLPVPSERTLFTNGTTA